MNKLVFITFCITFSFIKTVDDPIDYIKTEPYVTFDWLDDDKKTLTIVNTAGTSNPYLKCLLYNTTHVCYGSCTGTTKITCTFEGGNCGADSDNPTFKYYYTTYCTTANSLTGSSGKKTIDTNALGVVDVGVTVAVCNSHFIKYSMILLLSLLVL